MDPDWSETKDPIESSLKDENRTKSLDNLTGEVVHFENDKACMLCMYIYASFSYVLHYKLAVNCCVLILVTLFPMQPLDFLTSFSGLPDYVFKILVVGNSYVGKSSYLMRLCNASFSQRYCSTIGQSVCPTSHAWLP